MPNFKEFIKGFEEKPEAEQPKTPEVKAEQPKQQPKPVEQPQQGRMVYYQGKEMPFEEAKAQARESFLTPKIRKLKLSEDDEKFLDKASEYMVKEDDAYTRWDYETDPIKKAELNDKLDASMREINSFMREYDKKPIDQPKEGSFEKMMQGFEQPKENRDQIIEKVNQKMMNANTYGELGDKENYEKSIAEAEELRKGLAPNPQPKEGSFEQAFDEAFEENEYYNIEDYKNAAPNREVAQKLGNAKPTDFSPYVFDTDQGRFTIVNDEQAREDGAKTIQAYFQDEQGFDTFPAEIARDLKAKFGDPSQDEDLKINYQTVADYFIDKYGYSRMLTPHTGKVIDLGNGYKAYQITEKQGD